MKKFFYFCNSSPTSMPALNINDYRYNLPPERIALYPLTRRDQSRLLVYQKGEITHSWFHAIPGLLPDNSLLFFNDTKVIPARMHFTKETGADIEIFLLSPLQPSTVLSQTMQATSECVWQCTIGNLKRWKEPAPLTKTLGQNVMEAFLIDRENSTVKFRWTSGKTFAEIIGLSGETPLPPYLKRKPESEDRERYQTIYSHFEGAVAAPTAGLHFTDEIFKKLDEKGIERDFLTLHVSAGTFQPVKVEDPEEHIMHAEQVIVTEKNVDNLLTPGKFIIAVGTTSMRTLESLYWFGARLIQDPDAGFSIHQHDPYRFMGNLPTPAEAIAEVKKYMNRTGQRNLIGETAIFIRPGYHFRICRGLITNFHQPASTLMLLVAAFAGADWRKIYDEALKNDYRFLSYGDSSLLIP
jgi:S-adenosylmethionine:tRNA ribosyltransferase-isomerase